MDRFDKARQTRAKILEYIKENPGIHFNGIVKALDLSHGCLTYHIAKLEESGAIHSEMEKYWKRFYSVGRRGRRPQAIAPCEKELLVYIEATPGATYKDFVRDLGRTRQAHMYHIRKLVGMGFVRMTIVGREHRFYATRKKYL